MSRFRSKAALPRRVPVDVNHFNFALQFYVENHYRLRQSIDSTTLVSICHNVRVIYECLLLSVLLDELGHDVIYCSIRIRVKLIARHVCT